MAAAAIETRALRKVYPAPTGKTTTIGILTTRVVATAGTARVSGVDVATDAVRVRTHIGVVPQRPNPDRSLNALENLVYHAAYFGIARPIPEQRASELMTRLDILEKAQAKVDQLSGGQQQRLMSLAVVAIALIILAVAGWMLGMRSFYKRAIG